MRKITHRWTRLSTQKWEDAWRERLAFLSPDTLAFFTWPNSKILKIEAYCDEPTAQLLKNRFGGRSTKISPSIWSGSTQSPRAPIPIRGILKIFSHPSDLKKFPPPKKKFPIPLLIPPGIAFGTGEHSTTASCLRMLCDILPTLPHHFRAADLGCGSGILAIACSALGAKSVEALDNDPAAIRTTRQNARLNNITNLSIQQIDVLHWIPRHTPHLILANLYSDLLIEVTPRITEFLPKGAPFIFSGILASQLDEVCSHLRKNKLTPLRTLRRSKWSAGIATRS